MIKPMLCKNFHERYLDVNHDYICQIKYDGFRAVLQHNKRITKIALFRDYHDVTHHFPELKKLREKLFAVGIHQIILDGEIMSPSRNFKDLPALVGANTTAETAYKKREEVGHPNVVFFDVMEVNGANLRNWPFYVRARVLEALMERIDIDWCYFAESFCRVNSDHNCAHVGVIADTITNLATQVIQNKEEGLVVRDALGLYEEKRSSSCLKIKGMKTYDVVITGFDPPEKLYTGKSETWDYWVDKDDRRAEIPCDAITSLKLGLTAVTQDYFYNRIGAIRFGVYKDGELVEIGKCRGFTTALSIAMSEKQGDFIEKTIEIVAQGIIDSQKGSLRHPRFSRLRPDKNPKDCTWLSFLRT